MLRLGSRGRAVVDVQARLKRACYPELEVDGYFGEYTLMAAKRFQILNGLIIDGIIGSQTSAVLNTLTNEGLLYLFIHCTASPLSAIHVTGTWVKEYHTERKGWSRPGYSDVIELNGKLTNIYEYDHDTRTERDEYTWGTRLLNRNSRHVCYVGGVEAHGEAEDTRTDAQMDTLAAYVKTQIAYNPTLIVAGHNQVQRKACPSFDVVEWAISEGIALHNIALWNNNFKLK